jgi:hypothetical protein
MKINTIPGPDKVKLHFVVLTWGKLHWEWAKENNLNWIYMFDRF